MRFSVIGPVTVSGDGGDLPLGGPRQRAVLAVLLVRPGRAWTADALAEQVWGDDGPGAAPSLYTHVSALRHVIGAERLPHGPTGYRLELQADDVVDSLVLEAGVASARTEATDLRDLAGRLGTALSGWTARPYAGLEDVPVLAQEATRLTELRDGAEMDRLDALLRSGDDPPVAAARALRDERPLDERAWSLFVRALHRAGRRAEALAALRELRGTLREELGLDPSPLISRLEEQVLVEDPSLDAAPAEPVGLPRYLTSFVGRADDLRAVALALEESRLVTLTGPGGVGKTRLAVELALARSARHPDGTWFLDLNQVDSGEQVGQRLAALVGAPAAAQDPLADVRAALDGKRALLVVDNAEQVRGAVRDVVTDLLTRSAQLTVLVTSRVALGCDGERVVPLAGLPVGQGPERGEAETLFAARCRDRGAETDDEVAAVRALCTQLDGLPLGLEIAAGRRIVATPEEMVDLLSHRLSALTGEDAARETHRSIEAAIGWSHDLLDPADREAFAALGVFDGPFSLAAAAEVVGARDASQALAVLRRCVEASVVTASSDGGVTMFRLLRTLRTYARERLTEHGRYDAAAERHDRHYVARAEALADEFLGRGRVAATAQVLAELAEYRAAWQRLLPVDPVRLLPVGWAVGHVWMFEGRLAEGQARLTELVDATAAERSVARADLLMITSWVLIVRNATARARRLAEEGLALYRECGTPQRVAYGLARAGHLALATGDGEGAMAHLTESLALCERSGFEDGKAWPLVLVAQARRWGGDPSPEVREMILDARRRFAELGETYGQTHADMLLGGFTELGPDERLRFATEMVELSERPGGENLMRPIALHNLAYVVAEVGEQDRASGLNHAAVRASTSTGATMVLGMSLLQAAHLARERDDLEGAATLLGAGLAHFAMAVAPFQQRLLRPIREEGPRRLGRARFDELVRIGAGMSADEAARYALAR